MDSRSSQNSKDSASESFHKLQKLCKKFEPVKLLTQLSMTFLIGIEGQVIYPDDESANHLICIELINGIIFSMSSEDRGSEEPGTVDTNDVMVTCQAYLSNIDRYLVDAAQEDGSIEKFILYSAKYYSAHIRGESYPPKILQLAESIYNPLSDIFKKKYSFTFSDLRKFYDAIFEYINFELNAIRLIARSIAQEQTNAYFERAPSEDRSEEEIFSIYFNMHSFGKSDKVMGFDLESFCQYSKLDQQLCSNILKRLSFDVDEQWRFEGNVIFQDPLAAPWDFNKLYERPFVKSENKYFLAVPTTFHTCLLHTFYYDLIRDKKDKEAFKKHLGESIENCLVVNLKKIFPSDNVYQNLDYKHTDSSGKTIEKGEVDVLVKHDQTILLFQCKAKKLTLESKSGNSFNKLEQDLKGGIISPFLQNQKSVDYLSKNIQCSFYKQGTKDKLLEIDTNDETLIFPINITFGDYQGLSIQFEKLCSTFNFLEIDFKSYSCSLLDFSVVMEVLSAPYKLIHYIHRRLIAESLDTDLITIDEIELLGFYLRRNLHDKDEYFDQTTGIALSQWSRELDEYFHKKYIDNDHNLMPPDQKEPKNFRTFISSVAKFLRQSKFKSRTILALKDMSYEFREKLLSDIEACIRKSKLDKKKHDFRLFADSGLQICFLASYAKNEKELEVEIASYGQFLQNKVQKKANIVFCKNSNNFASRFFDRVAVID